MAYFPHIWQIMIYRINLKRMYIKPPFAKGVLKNLTITNSDMASILIKGGYHDKR